MELRPGLVPDRRLTGKHPASLIASPGGQPPPQASRQPRICPVRAPRTGHTAASASIRARRHTKDQVTATVLSVQDRQFCR